MSFHELCDPDEVFAGNSHTPDETLKWLHAQGVTCARLGNQAYDIDGNLLPPEYRPIFVSRKSADVDGRYNHVMMSRTFGPNWRQNR